MRTWYSLVRSLVSDLTHVSSSLLGISLNKIARKMCSHTFPIAYFSLLGFLARWKYRPK